jgi:NADH:ubiquinone oxidoreductase subunit 6 (subunit J)
MQINFDKQNILEVFIFFLFAGLLLGSSMAVFLSNKLIYKAFSLLLALLCVAAIFVFGWADFVAASQIMVYVGGILVLLVFSLLFTKATHTTSWQENKSKHFFWVFVILVLTFCLFYVFKQVNFDTLHANKLAITNEKIAKNPNNISTIRIIGTELMTTQLIAFEFAGLFLVVMLAGVALVTKETK